MTTKIILLPDVSLRGLQAPIVVGLSILQAIASNMEIPSLTISHAVDGKHTIKTLHGAGLALDIRSHDIKKEQKGPLVKAFNAAAGKQFDFFLEDEGLANEHFHMEWDEHA